ncbi:uncharacterized protein LOC127874246 isoform X2 [Dreissena polymorpha]|nr:uncharacterized protein LOC127874246 isoform X2 [Dreissena polymorpha]
MFQSRSALIKHLSSAEHRRLTVICPWCSERTRSFTQISDLEVHVKKTHPENVLPDDRFSRSNGFYFAMYPLDYARIVDSVAPYNSNAAHDVRKAVRNWANGFPDSSDRMDKWYEGWKAGVAIAMGHSKERTSLNSETCDVGIRNEGVERSFKKRMLTAEEHERNLLKRRKREEDIEPRGRDKENEERERDVQMMEHYIERDVSTRRMEDVRDGKAMQRMILRPSVEGMIDSLASFEDNKILGEEETPHVAPQQTSERSIGATSSTSENYDSPGLRNRAFKILKRGSMPMCPPPEGIGRG